VTTYRLTGGKAVPKLGAVLPPSEVGCQTWTPNQEPDTLLVCGCTIPWPIVALVGSGGKQVMCSDHGQQRVTGKEIARCKRGLANARVTTQNDLPF
jgi:hypothetical protein